MTGSRDSNRWWENYLVRYLMPSIAGIVIVGWLLPIGGIDLKSSLFFGLPGDELSAPTLTLLVLYGNLFCYIASFPILGFHATRVIDFRNSNCYLSILLDGYLLSLVVGIGALLINAFMPMCAGFVAAYALVILFSIAQLVRLCKAMKRQQIKWPRGETMLAYAYISTLAERRAMNSNHEVIETYRHMREHGNSAFIFFLELVLASLCHLVLSVNGCSAQHLSHLGILFAIWTLPAVAIHLFSQIIERQFSQFDEKL